MVDGTQLFRLYGDTILVRNGSDSTGVLYLLVEKKMFWLRSPAIDVLEALEKNLTIERAAERTSRTVQDICELLITLQAAGAGSFVPQPCYVEKIRTPSPLSNLVLFQPQVQFRRLHVYLTERCTMDCAHCGRTTVSRLRPCDGCGRIPGLSSQTRDLDSTLLTKTLRDAAELGCQSVSFHVGDSTIIEGLVVDALEAASVCGFPRVELITGGAVHGHVLETVIAVDASLTFQVYAADATCHDANCGRPGTFDKIQETIRILEQAGKSFALVCLRINPEGDTGHSIKMLSDLRPERLALDRVVTPALLEDPRTVRTLVDECLTAPDVASYLLSLERSCMHGQFTLAHDGSLFACPFVSGARLGHADEISISEIIELEAHHPFWKGGALTRADCLECPLRLACNLCSAARGVGTDLSCAIASWVYEHSGIGNGR